MSLLVENAKAPLAIGCRTPHLSWEVPLVGRNRRQSAYHILVATSKELLVPGKADMWDSGKVESNQSTNIRYAGVGLKSNTDYCWTVQVWDESGIPAGFVEPQFFGTALLDESDWKAKWIGMFSPKEPEFDPYSMTQGDATSGGLRLAEDDFQLMAPEFRDFKPELRSPYLRKEFMVSRPVKRARVFVCGLGLFELRLNGQKVGDDVLNTPRTDFAKRAYYFTYDVTGLLGDGKNAMGVILGGGWYNAQKKYWHWQAPWFGSPRALVQLVVELEDGATETFISDDSWQGDWSPISLSCIYDGEDYDAQKEQIGWDAPGFDANHWKCVNVVSAPGGRLVPMDHQPNKVMKRWSPISVAEPEPGVFVFDMGTVMTGWVQLRIPQGKSGQTVALKYSELCFDTGMIAPDRSAGGARQADFYTMKEGAQTYEPRFTYHGFRYVEVTGFPGTPTLETLEACYVYNGVEQAGTFECGNDLVNKIHACTLQSQRCNMQMGVPTDDTQREERLGWCGDAWSYAHECFYNFDSARFWKKWIADFYDQQDEESGLVGYICPLPGWGEDLVWSAAFVYIPWWHYIHYGDKQILENSYPYLKKYLAYLERTGKKELPSLKGRTPPDLLFPETSLEERYPSPDQHGYLQHSWFADHLAIHEGGSGMGNDQPRSMATAFYHYDAVIMARIADTLGHDGDAAEYRKLADKIQKAYHDYFFDKDSRHYDIGCQSAQALALCFELVPADQRDRVQSYLNSSVNFRQRRITSGYAGTKWVIDSIAKSGRNDIIWSRAIATDYPSWGFMLGADEREGLQPDEKTTICENWAGGASQCHTTLGAAIDEWFYWGLAGIRPDESAPGFENVIIQPYLPKDLPWAKASVKTVRGLVASEWTHDGQTATLTITIPANSSATVVIPFGDSSSIVEGFGSLVDVEGVNSIETVENTTIIQTGSGTFQFQWPE